VRGKIDTASPSMLSPATEEGQNQEAPMKIIARVRNQPGAHDVVVSTNGRERSIAIPPRDNQPGSSVNGGELLFLALATCYCNDQYGEAAIRGIAVEGVEVEVSGSFAGPGEPARAVNYSVAVASSASEAEVAALIAHTDTVVEIQNTVRTAIPVTLAGVTILREAPKPRR
jgi:organic hydroperoxide reductase OsmC/OhrA